LLLSHEPAGPAVAVMIRRAPVAVMVKVRGCQNGSVRAERNRVRADEVGQRRAVGRQRSLPLDTGAPIGVSVPPGA
jgi:hypothetical protein